jgi:phosphate transport system ATP-binding protein
MRLPFTSRPTADPAGDDITDVRTPAEIAELEAGGIDDAIATTGDRTRDDITDIVTPASSAGSGADDITDVLPAAATRASRTRAQQDDAGMLTSATGTTAGRVSAPSSRRRPRWPRGAHKDAPHTADDVRRRAFGDTRPGELFADSITAWFGTHKVLDRVSLDMRAGEVTALIGPSGCGKSTFLRILNRMHEQIPTAKLNGKVLLDGEDLYAPDRRLTVARRQVGMVFHKPNPFPAESIYDNVVSGFALSGIRLSRDEKDLIVEDSLRKASLWEEVKDRLEQKAGGLSGGQQQRLCIARSLAVSPRVLLMDEPCSALDPTSTLRVEETIEQLKGSTTIVIVTHNMQQARRVSDRTAFFLAAQNTPGVIVEYGNTEAMFDAPQSDDTFRYVNGQFG